MTAVLGSTVCAVTGCGRRRHVSGEGRVVYGRCLSHTLSLLNAFGDSRLAGRSPEVSPEPRVVSASQPVAVPAYRPAA